MSSEPNNDTVTLIDSLEYLDAGITIFDKDFRLLASNRRFRELLAFPYDLCGKGTHIAEFFRFNARRGEYGPGDVETQVADRLAIAQARQPYRVERIRPDGTVIEVRGSTLPDGGLITIYTDVTERHRHAAELEAARQDLEKRVEERTRELTESQQKLAEKTRVLETIVGEVPLGITMFNRELELVVANRQFHDLMRIPLELGSPGTPFAAFMRLNALRGEYGEGNIDALVSERVDRAHNMSRHRFERVRPDGSAVEVTGTPLPEGGFVTTYTDITERKNAEAALHESEDRLRTVLETGPIAVCIADLAEGRIQFCNQRMADLLGFRHEELIGSRLSSFATDPEKWHAVMSRYFSGHDVHAEEIEFAKNTRGSFWGLVTIRALQFQKQASMLIWIYDVTELLNARESMASMAYYDTLTGLGNRRHFQEAADRILARARRLEQACALLYCDLDGFKLINDTLGHEAGDIVLVEVARRLESCLRKDDLVSRFGGDEFAIIIENIRDQAGTQAVASAILDRISAPIHHAGKDMQVGISVGVVIYEGSSHGIEHLIRTADQAMYAAKQSGKGRIVVACIYDDAATSGSPSDALL